MIDARKLARILLWTGVIILAVAVFWWWTFYSSVMREMSASDRGHMGEALRCLFVSSGPCGFIAGLASMGGYLAYSPVVFWAGLIVLAAGCATMMAQVPASPPPRVQPADPVLTSRGNLRMEAVASEQNAPTGEPLAAGTAPTPRSGDARNGGAAREINYGPSRIRCEAGQFLVDGRAYPTLAEAKAYIDSTFTD